MLWLFWLVCQLILRDVLFLFLNEHSPTKAERFCSSRLKHNHAYPFRSSENRVHTYRRQSTASHKSDCAHPACSVGPAIHKRHKSLPHSRTIDCGRRLLSEQKVYHTRGNSRSPEGKLASDFLDCFCWYLRRNRLDRGPQRVYIRVWPTLNMEWNQFASSQASCILLLPCSWTSALAWTPLKSCLHGRTAGTYHDAVKSELHNQSKGAWYSRRCRHGACKLHSCNWCIWDLRGCFLLRP